MTFSNQYRLVPAAPEWDPREPLGRVLRERYGKSFQYLVMVDQVNNLCVAIVNDQSVTHRYERLSDGKVVLW